MSNTEVVKTGSWAAVRGWLIVGYVLLVAVLGTYIMLGADPHLAHDGAFHLIVSGLCLLAAVAWALVVRAAMRWHDNSKLEYAKGAIAIALFLMIMNLVEVFWSF